MENKAERRWGIVAVAVAMFFVTMVNTSINGQKSSIYYAVWFFVGLYGYKGNLEQIKSLMKFFILLNLIVLVGVVLFVHDDAYTHIYKEGTKESIIVGVFVMLIPKIWLYFYSSKKLKEKVELNYENKSYENYTDDALLEDAVMGNKNAQFKIGQQYWLGDERINDARLAYAWLKIAKDSGSDASKFYLENTVYKQIDSNDANNSIELYQDIKNAIANKDVLLCELIINKRLSDKNIKINQKEEADKTEVVNIDFSLHTNDFKEKYGVNDYDYAKAINEMNGVLADAPMRTDLMNECLATTVDVKQAQKKYIYTRAFQISKSINRDAPHIVKADASKLFSQSMADIFGEKQSGKKPYKNEDTESFSKWAITNIGKGLIVGLALMFGIVGVINLIANNSVPSTDKKEEKIVNKSEDSKPNFFFNDLTYDLKNCEIKDEKNEAIHISKIQTSNNERTSVIYGDKKRTFAGCLLFGRDYTCTDAEDNKKIKIIFDVIYENLTFQKYRNNDINENDLEVEISCEAFAVYK